MSGVSWSASFFGNNGFMPHGHCYLWQAPLVWSHALSDLLTGIAYVAIAISLAIIIKKVQIPFSGMVLAFGLFIGACGGTHIMEVWNLWHSDYWAAASIKIVTALASVATSVGLLRLRPQILSVAEAAKLAHSRRLDLEVLAKSLEERVRERTQELQQSREDAQRIARELEIVMDATPSLISYIGPDFRYLMANAEYERRYGISSKEIVGREVKEVIGEEPFAQIRPSLERALKGEKVVFELTLPIPNLGERFVRVSYVPSRDPAGDVLGVITLVTDLTEQHEAKKRAEDANRAKSAFLANMSHEIRTPLGAILGFTELMADPALKAEERTHFAEIVNRNGRQLSNLINDILDLSKVEAGRLEIERVDMSLPELLKESVDFMSVAAEKKGLGLSLQIEPNVPDVIHSDPLRLRQIVLNVIGNAIKFTNRGKIDVVVRRHKSESERVSVQVRDTGIGILPENRERLFQPFVQADSSTTRQFGGTGLGLMLSRSLARTLGGDLVLLESSVGQGSVFELIIDAKVPAEISRVVPAASVKEDRSKILAQLKVLAVDDAPDNQLLVKLYLAPTGAQVDFVSNGAEAVERAKTGNYDVILMDIQMPVMDGYEATRLIRSAGFRGPIIALTAHAFKEEVARALEVGCDRHISKPLSREELLQAITAMADGEKTRAQKT